MKKSSLLLCGWLQLMLIGCGQNEIVEPQLVEPGKLKLTLVRGLGKASSPTLFEDVSYDLGNIRSSVNFYFLVSNVGGTTITNIRLTVNDSGFSVYPTRLDSVKSGTTVDLRHLEELPIIRVSVTHGTSLSGSGFVRLMNQGANSSVLHITGMTRSTSGGAVQENLSALLRVNALRMSVAIRDGHNEIDLSRPTGGGILVGGFLNNQFVSRYLVRDTARVTNTGNVPIVLTLFNTYNTYLLGVGESRVIGWRPRFHVSLFADNTVADPARFRFYSDGRAYLYLDHD